jgi:UDP-glucuronate 4-epimerase
MILVTGAAGFIGMHLAQRLLRQGETVVGFDNLNAYYSVELKQDRLRLLEPYDRFTFVKGDLADAEAVDAVFREYQPRYVVHLAAQAGVRYSLENPRSYVDSNLMGFVNILEAVRHHPAAHLLYASSSSVYGGSKVSPFTENQPVDKPVSLYAATKKANELMAHTYAHLFAMPVTGLRFFTVYGPWGRPDMSPYLFADAIAHGRPLKVFNHGHMTRDFTYVDDVVSAVVALLPLAPGKDDSEDAPARILNIGNSTPIQLMDYIQAFERAFGRTAEKIMLPMQPGDVVRTEADTSALQALVGRTPATQIQDGVNAFVAWYREYHAL